MVPVTSPSVAAIAAGPTSGRTHWLLPINPASHGEHMPPDWRTRADTRAVWEAIGRTQPIERWCLRSGFRSMRAGHLVWAYLSRRQELCALGVVREVVEEDGAWHVLIDWDEECTDLLTTQPIPRAAVNQVPMSVCRAGAAAASVLEGWLTDHAGAAIDRP